MAERLRRIKVLTDTSLLSHEMRGDQLRLGYRLDASDEVQAIVELERSCCAFLDFDVRDVGRSVEPSLSAAPWARDSAAWLFTQFLPSKSDAASTQCGCDTNGACG